MRVGLLAGIVLSLVVAGVVAEVAAALVAVSAGSEAAGIVLRTVLTGLMAFLLTRILVRRAYAGSELMRTVAAAAVLSYLLSPGAWVGRAMAGQLVIEPGVGTFVIDGVLWVGVVLLSAVTVHPQPVEERLPYQGLA